MPVGAVFYLTAPHPMHMLRLNGVQNRDWVRRAARQAGVRSADAVWSGRPGPAVGAPRSDLRGTAAAVAPLVTLFPLATLNARSPPIKEREIVRLLCARSGTMGQLHLELANPGCLNPGERER
jgi:hypothetical protein